MPSEDDVHDLALDDADDPNVSTQLVENISRLEDELAHERDARREERFLWVFALTLVADGGLIWNGVDFSGVVLLLLQIVFLMLLAWHFKIDWAYKLLGDLFDHLKRRDPEDPP